MNSFSDPEYWQKQRGIGDPLADAAIRSALKGSIKPDKETREDVSVAKATVAGAKGSVKVLSLGLISELMHSKTLSRGLLDPVLQQFLRESEQLPSWYDHKKIQESQRFFKKNGIQMAFILLMRSLPESYCNRRGVEVLHATGRLTVHATYKAYTKRVMETLQFALDVMGGQRYGPDGVESGAESFGPNGRATETVQKIRLMHAAIRHYISEDGDPWDTAELGVPINQEDLAVTLTTFTVSVLKGLEQLGVTVKPHHRESFVHCWAVAGHILGLNPENIPRTYAEAETVQNVIMDRQNAYSETGAELTRALIDYVQSLTPGFLMVNAIPYFIGCLLGKERSQYVGISGGPNSRVRGAERFTDFLMGMFESLRRRPAVASFTPLMTKLVYKGVIRHFNGQDQTMHAIPMTLQDTSQNVGTPHK